MQKSNNTIIYFEKEYTTSRSVPKELWSLVKRPENKKNKTPYILLITTMESNDSNKDIVLPMTAEEERNINELIESVDGLTIQGTPEELDKLEKWSKAMKDNIQIYAEKVVKKIREIEAVRRKDPTDTTVDADVQDCIDRVNKSIEIIHAFVLLVQYDLPVRAFYKERILRYLKYLRKPSLPFRKSK